MKLFLVILSAMLITCSSKKSSSSGGGENPESEEVNEAEEGKKKKKKQPSLNDPAWALALGQSDLQSVDQREKSYDGPLGLYGYGDRLFVGERARLVIWDGLPTSDVKPARVLGQENLLEETYSASVEKFDRAGGVYADANVVIAATLTGNQVLIWNSPGSVDGEVTPDVILGKSSGTLAETMNYTYGVHSDGTRLVVADSTNNRVLIWNTIPTTNYQAPDLVLGQADLTTNTANFGGLSASSLSQPRGLFINGSQLWVTDNSNNRVLVWTTFPTTNNQAADLVLGQANFTSNSANPGGVSGTTLYGPSGVFIYGSQLFVCDAFNNRVLVWDNLPTVNQQSPDMVLGQPSFTVRDSVAGASGMSGPHSVWTNGSQFYVADLGNHRILGWNSIPQSNAQKAKWVMGQDDFSGENIKRGSLNARRISAPVSAATDGSRFMVGDEEADRVMIWNSFPTEHNQPADLVIGQPSLDEYVSAATSAKTVISPYGLSFLGQGLAVADKFSNRVLVWNDFPTQNHQAADVVLGQSDFSSTGQSLTASGLKNPLSLSSSGQTLAVADTGYNRVLLWSSIPTSNGQAADVVVGKPDFVSSTNLGGTAANSLSGPAQVVLFQNKLVVADTDDNRVLIWNGIPTSNHQPADVVLGQPDFDSDDVNNGGLSAASMNNPTGVAFNGKQLFVMDSGNERLLVWSSLPSDIQAPADLVIGLDSLEELSEGNSGSILTPGNYEEWSIAASDTHLIISDTGYYRTLVLRIPE